jgi:DNA-binding Lrp family transcriptional regulator
MRTVMPLARDDGALMMEEFGDELLIYDNSLKRAHSLGAVAASVWRLCDGSTDVETIAARLDTTETEVRAAVDELEVLGLMKDDPIQVVQSGKSERSGITRRQMTMRSVKTGAAVLTAPLVYSINVNPALAEVTATIQTCFKFTTSNCGAGNGCGAVAGCCCCCRSDGECKTCGSIAACDHLQPGGQPCAPVNGGGISDKLCADSHGTFPANERGCCSVFSANNCGCGWGPGGGCCKPGGPAGQNNCDPALQADADNEACVPCCNGTPLPSGAAFGCCKSTTVNCCVANPPACCGKSGFEPGGNHEQRDCCTNPTLGCCADNSCVTNKP